MRATGCPLVAVLLATALLGGQQASAPAQAPAQAQIPTPVPAPEPARPPFSDWLAGLRAEAAGRGIRAQTLDAALGDVAPVEQVQQRDRTQAEFVISFDKYVKRWLSKPFVRLGREKKKTHDAPAEARGCEVRRGAERPAGAVGCRVQLRAVLRCPARHCDARDAGLRRASWGLLPRRTARRARHPRPRGHRACADARLVGRRHGAAAVHAVQLPEVRGGPGRGRQAGHLGHPGRRVRLHRELPRPAGVATGRTLGPRGRRERESRG